MSEKINYLLKFSTKRMNYISAHLWNGSDTLCTLYSTGGIKNKKLYKPFDLNLNNLPVCKMCKAVYIRDHIKKVK